MRLAVISRAVSKHLVLMSEVGSRALGALYSERGDASHASLSPSGTRARVSGVFWFS